MNQVDKDTKKKEGTKRSRSGLRVGTNIKCGIIGQNHCEKSCALSGLTKNHVLWNSCVDDCVHE